METENNNIEKEWGKEVFDLLSWYEMDRVKNAKVMVVGAGALGNEVLKNLALFGVGTIFIVDFDTIEYSNLTRSVLFRESDADKGYFKAEVAARKVREINPNIKVYPIVGRLGSDVGFGIYRKMDVVIGCLDSRLARVQLNRLCMRANIPWVEGGIENLTGNVRVFKPGECCYECGLTENAKQNIFQSISCAGVAHRSEKMGRVPTTPVIASIIGAVQVQEAMKQIHKEEIQNGVFSTLVGKWFHYEGMHNKTAVYDARGAWSDDCPSHEMWDNILRIPTLSAGTAIKDAFQIIKDTLDVNEVEINLRNDKFVDVIINRMDNQRFTPMLPESRIPDYIDNTYELYTCQRSALNQNAYEDINADFPYQRLTLKQIGIPHFDVLQVTTEKGMYYVELSADESLYFPS